MVIIADSGSTKTTWVLCDKNQVITNISTPGLNPNFASDKFFSDTLTEHLLPAAGLEESHSIFFYGSGVADDYTISKVYKAISAIFPSASIEVGSDLKGAARALFGDEKGIACIIGTGSNSCLCDEGEVIHNIPSLGFILGDEGSGAYLGKMILSDYLKGIMPVDIATRFTEQYNTDKQDVTSRVYRGEFPSRYVAGFVSFIAANLDSPYLSGMVRNGFRVFMERNVLHYNDCKNLLVSFTGSVAWYFRDILLEIIDEKNLTPGDIIRDPAERILSYHLNKIKPQT
jgi:N-acetylglucosamine kinase-like BadF-type ATPase